MAFSRSDDLQGAEFFDADLRGAAPCDTTGEVRTLTRTCMRLGMSIGRAVAPEQSHLDSKGGKRVVAGVDRST